LQINYVTSLFTGSLGWHARAIKKLHPHVNHVIVADLADVVKVGKALEENRNAGIEYTIGTHMI
jgi:hypothetical protein